MVDNISNSLIIFNIAVVNSDGYIIRIDYTFPENELEKYILDIINNEMYIWITEKLSYSKLTFRITN